MNNQEDLCPITWEPLKNCQKVKKLDCSHRFDLAALVKYIEQSNLCPVCKKEIPLEECQDLFVEALEIDDIYEDDVDEDEDDEEYIPEIHENKIIPARRLSSIPPEMKDFIVPEDEDEDES